MADRPPIEVYVGDMWTFSCTLTAAGSPVDMAAHTVNGERFSAYRAQPIDLTFQSGSAASDSPTGDTCHSTVRPDQPSPANSNAVVIARAKASPTCIQVWDVGTLGRGTTRGIILIATQDPRSA